MRRTTLLATGLCLVLLGGTLRNPRWPSALARSGDLRRIPQSGIPPRHSTTPSSRSTGRFRTGGSAHLRRPQRIPALGARGAADSGRLTVARLLARQPAGKADQRTESRARCSSTIASPSAGCAAARSSRWPHTTNRPASCSTHSTSGPMRRPDPPQFKRAFECLGCHLAGDTLGVPGLLMFSTTRPDRSQGFSLPRSGRSERCSGRRFGGWFVTGSTGTAQHLGNDVAALDGRASRELTSVEALFDADGYRALSSDVAAHLVFTHQVGMANLLTRANWQARAADPALHPPFTAAPDEEARIAVMMSGVASEVVDYLLFIDEARLTDRVRGASGFAERFSASGPRDRKGALAARARPESPPHEVPVQLFDLFAGFRRVAGEREGPDLPPPVGGAVGSGTGRPLPVSALSRRPPSHRRESCETPRKTCHRIFRT